MLKVCKFNRLQFNWNFQLFIKFIKFIETEFIDLKFILVKQLPLKELQYFH